MDVSKFLLPQLLNHEPAVNFQDAFSKKGTLFKYLRGDII